MATTQTTSRHALLELDLPWLEQDFIDEYGSLRLRRSDRNVLTFDDGVNLEVVLLSPSAARRIEDLVAADADAGGPGRLTLVAGEIPPEWRASLREAGVSFLDPQGVAEISWPGVHVSEARFGQAVDRRSTALPLRQGSARVVQALLIAAVDGRTPSIGELATEADVGISTASRAVSQLERHGYVRKRRDATRVDVEVTATSRIAERLAAETGWPGGGEVIPCYRWGRSVGIIASDVSEAARRERVRFAVTGSTAASFLGVIGTSAPRTIRCWVRTEGHLVDAAQALGLEPASASGANIELARDQRGLGTDGAFESVSSDGMATISHPVRIWCDLYGEQRGEDVASQFGRVIGAL
jgi:DNA-binding MarR family transcriptional regulator